MLYYSRFIWLIIMYMVGSYLFLYSSLDMKKSLKSAIISFGIIVISILVIDYFEPFFNYLGTTEVAYFWHQNSVPLFILSVSIFGIFTNLEVPTNKIINKLSSTTLAIYILHDGVLGGFLRRKVFNVSQYIDSPFLIFHIIWISVAIFLGGALIDLIRQVVEKYTVVPILNKILKVKV